MTIEVFLAVLLAAGLHASWNALVKHAGDKHVSMTAVVLGHTPLALVVLLLVPLPAPPSWPYLITGAALHMGYQLFLLWSYRIGDLTQVYPIARGVAPMIVAAVSVLILGVDLSTTETIAIFIIGSGIMSLVFVRGSEGLRNPKASATALAAGCFIASYSLVDGLGARQSGSPAGFFAWLTIINAAAFAIFMGITRPGVLKRVVTEGRFIALVGGTASFIAYALVVWAFTKAPIALVTAFRETSIIFALLIGVVFLKEKLNLTKVVSTMATVLGVILLRSAR